MQAALPEPVAPPAAGRGEAAAVAAAAWREVASSSSASSGQFWAGRPLLHQSPGGRIWRNAPPERGGGICYT